MQIKSLKIPYKQQLIPRFNNRSIRFNRFNKALTCDTRISKVDNHKHNIVLPPIPGLYQTSYNDNHTHTIKLTRSQANRLKIDKRLVLNTNIRNNHLHIVTITCNTSN